MGQITVEKNVGGIVGLCVITPAVHGDARGYFMETYNENDMKEAGIDIKFVQDNQSMSSINGFSGKLSGYIRIIGWSVVFGLKLKSPKFTLLCINQMMKVEGKSENNI